MFPYYLLIFVPMLVAAIRSKGIVRLGPGAAPEDRRSTTISLFFLIFFLLLALRDLSCGADTGAYVYFFLSSKVRTWRELLLFVQWEKGYSVFNKVLSYLTEEPRFFLTVTSLVSLLPVFLFYKKEAEIPVLSIVLFATVAPFPMYFSGVRQAIAMAFAFPAWYCAREQKLLKFLLLILLAFCFHHSAAVMLAIYPLYQLRITKKWLLAVVPGIALVYIFNRPIFLFLASLLREDYGQITGTSAFTVLFLLILFLVYVFVIPEEAELDQDICGYRNLLLLSIVIQCFAPLHSLAMRLNYYFLPFLPILIPKIANRSKWKYRSVANVSVIVMTVFFSIFFFIRAYGDVDLLQIYPYVPFWHA